MQNAPLSSKLSASPCHASKDLDNVVSINAGRLPRALTLIAAQWTGRHYSHIQRMSVRLLSCLGLHMKMTAHNNLTEAHTLRFVAAHTSIPVPRVYCAFYRKGITYIVMSKVKGHVAAQCWGNRSNDSKAAILHQLSCMVAELRSVTPPHGARVGSTEGGPICDGRLPSKLFWGPYPTVTAFHEALIGLGNIPTIDFSKLPSEVTKLILWLMQVPEIPVLTHGDLSSLNIMVKGDRVVGIVDWETAGWLPNYWEYVFAWNVNPRNLFWQNEVDRFLVADPEAREMDSIRRRFFGDF